MGRVLGLSMLAWSACTLSSGAIDLDRVEPASGTNVEVVPVRIEGANFHLPIRSDVDDGSTVVGDLTVTIGDVQLIDAARRDDQLIEGSVPAGLPIGDYDVTVQLGEATDILVAGYRVLSARVQPPAGPCGRPGVIADNFADGIVAPTWFVDNAANVVEQGGTLEVTPLTTGETGYRSNPYVDLTGGAAEVEVRTMVTGIGASAFFRLSHGADVLGFRQSDGMLAIGIEPALIELAFDPVAHGNWRVAEAGGTVTFETSPDGVTWTTRHSAATPGWVGFATVSLGANNPNAIAAPGTVTFAEFSTYVAPAIWCPTTRLSDGFDDGVIGAEWAYHARTSGGCTEFETGSAANADQNGSAACDAYYAASALYSLEGSEMVVRITSITTFTPGWITYLGAYDLEGRFVRLYFEQNTMCVDGTDVAKICAAYDTAEDLWRIREAGGTLLFEVADSTVATFRLIHSVAVPFSITAVRPRFGTATDRTIGTSIGLSIDRFN